MMPKPSRINDTRRWMGVALREWAGYAWALHSPGTGWLALRNRRERLEPAPELRGVRCDWEWTSELHAPKLMPGLGLRLLRRALAAHPVRRLAEPEHTSRPVCSFVVGHRGDARLPHLLATLESIAGQRGAAVECIVVELDDTPRAKTRLPSWVRHVHLPVAAGTPFSRSAALNAGAALARGDVLILHDNDMLAPADYAASVVERVQAGWEVVNLKRFVFYLGREHTAEILEGRSALDARPPEAIVQNLEAGGSVGLTRRAFDRIGGMDESFSGWGGEDNEFWDRACTLRTWTWAWLPIVHLWHPAQPEKRVPAAPGSARYYALRETAPAERIARLLSRREAP